MEVEKKMRSVGTHDDAFHADEVTACALLCAYGLVDSDKIVRTRDVALLSQCDFVCDVGGEYDPTRKLFDHHQMDYRGELSSAGMILEYLHSSCLIDDEEYHFLRNSLIKGVDDHDNGRSEQTPGICTFSHVIANFLPILYDARPKDYEEGFFEALAFALGHIERLKERHAYTLSCRKLVAQEMKRSKQYLVFDRKLPWLENFFALGGRGHSALFVVMPAGDHWKLRAIPPSWEDRMNVRLPLPRQWAGLLEEDLRRVSGIEEAIFCHKGRFISVWETKEAALEALAYTFKEGDIHADNL